MWRVGLLLLPLWILACGAEDRPPSDPELRAELGIADRVPIHRFDLSGSGDATRIVPRSREILAGDVVQFVVLGHRVQLLTFALDELPPGGRDFLESTHQDSFPPLVEQGSRIVLSFEGAPPGRYPFRIEGSGPAVSGEIVVRRPN